MEALKYLERLRSSKPFLLKRKRDIIDSRKEKLLEEEIEDIDFCLDVISDTNADTYVNTLSGTLIDNVTLTSRRIH